MTDYLLFIDTETSGVPRNLYTPKEKLNQWPYILQIGWLVYTKEGKFIKKENHFINTGNIKIARKSAEIHGITLQLLHDIGKERKDVIQTLFEDIKAYLPMIVGHFIEFDKRMLDVGFHRAGIENVMQGLPHFCTMRVTSKLNDSVLLGKFMRLEELHIHLFNKGQVNAHDALSDAETTAACFFELKRQGIITEETILEQQNYSYSPIRKRGAFWSILVMAGAFLVFLFVFYLIKKL